MKILVAIPCMATIHTQFFRSVLSLQMPSGENYTEFTMTENSLIYDARNIMAHKAVEGGFDRVLWLDSDMVFDRDLFQRLSAWIDTGYDYVSGLYFRRNGAPYPVVYKYVGFAERNGEKIPVADPFFDYPENELFEVAATGFGGVMMTVDLIREVKEKFGLPFSPALGFGEDLSFCQRVKQIGKKMYCDSSIKLSHIANRLITEETYRRYADEQSISSGADGTGNV